MRITNARIKNVTVGFDDRGWLSVMMTFEGRYRCDDWRFILTNLGDVQRLIKLLSYTESHEVEDLNGKIIRRVDFGNSLRGFGHPIEDKFVPTLTEEFKEISKSEFEELLKDI